MESNPIIERREQDDTENGNFYEYIDNNLEKLAERYIEDELEGYDYAVQYITRERLIELYREGGQDRKFEAWINDYLERRGEE